MHDLHIHTTLSSCAGPDARLADYLPELLRRKFAAVGFANHLWDRAVPGASDWYRPQDIDHVMQLKSELAGLELPGTRVYFGCETEYLGGGVVGLAAEHAALFDFVLVPPHHFHMAGFTRPADLTEPAAVRNLMIERFYEVCDLDFAFGLAHPFLPMGYRESGLEILRGISDDDFGACYGYAAAKGKSIEINLSIFRSLPPPALDEYRRMMTVAARCGCRFHLGSDAHGMADFAEAYFDAAARFAGDCGIVLPEDPLSGD